MTNSKLFLAAACAAALSLGASAASWSVDNGIASVTADCELTEADQATIDTLTSINVAAGKVLYAASGNTVTTTCEIVSSGVPKSLGKAATGTLVIAGKVSAVGELPFEGDVRLADGASFGSGITMVATYGNNPQTVLHFASVLPATSSMPTCRLRGRTAVVFETDNVFGNVAGPFFVLGRNSNAAGILDLNGHDQTIRSMSFCNMASVTKFEDFAQYHYMTSDTAATLTVTNTFTTTTGGSSVFNGRLLGGLSFKLDSKSNGSASFSNVLEQVSSTTGSLICAAGTIKLLDGSRFNSLTSIRKEGTGNFEISTSVINTTVDLYLDGTGKVTLNNDIVVSHAYTNDTNGGWVCLKANDYDKTALGAHIDGSGKITVLYDDTVIGDSTYTWTGAQGNGTLTDGGNWEGGEAPTLNSVGERLVFPATGTSSCRVDGTIMVGGIEIAYPGAFTMQAGTDAKILLGEGGLSVADTTTQTNAVTVNAPIRLLNGVADVTFSVGAGTAFNLAGGISAASVYGRRLVIDGGALTFGGDSSGMLEEIAITNASSVTVTSASGLGAGGATIYGELVPYFDGTRTCTSPWSVIGPFAGDGKFRYLYPAVAGSPFTFYGAVSFEGTLGTVEPKGVRYTGYVVLIIRNDTIFRGGIAVDKLARLELNYGGKSNTVYVLDHPVVRGTKSPSDRVDVRFYGASATNSFAVTDQDVGSAVDGVYVSKCSLVCAADSCVNGVFRPYVNSRDPGNGDPVWSKFDLNGHDQTFKRILSDSNIAAGKFPMYPDSYVEVTSETAATLTFGETTVYTDIHQMKFTGAVSLRTADPWAGTILITNTVSTTTGDLTITSGCLGFLKDAGWGGGTNVTVSGTGKLLIDEGAKPFLPVGGGASKVNLKLEGYGKLNITNAATVVSVRTCETNGVRLARGYYTAATLPGFLTGDGTLHVRMMYSNGTSICIR